MDYTYNQYINDVSTGRIPACTKVKQAVNRHISDLKQAKKGTFPYHFDDIFAQRAINFFRQMYHTKGKWAGHRFEPEPWQQFIIASIYGWRCNDTNKRRFRRAYIEIPRKNGKTFLSSGVGLYDLLSEHGSEVYSVATKKTQAARCFQDAKNTVRYSKPLKKKVEIFAHSLTFRDGTMQALSSESNTLDGLNPSCAIVDEYHAHKSDELVNVMETGMAAREQPLLFIITTAGNNINCPCHEEYERVEKILSGFPGYENDTYFCIVYELDKGDDWKQEKNWSKANPNLGVSVDINDLRIQLQKALQKSTDENAFRTKNLDEWLNNVECWITDTKWQKCLQSFDEENINNATCWMALDLSKRLDFTALTLVFLLPNKKRYQKHFFFIPEAQIEIKMRTDSYMIRQWIKQGYIFATPGETVDYDFIYKKIFECAKKYEIRKIAYDRNLSEKIITPLSDEFDCVDFPQSIKYMSEPSKNWEKFITDNQIIDNNPVERWMVSCATIYTDPNDNIKVVKPDQNKTSKRIDGVITSIMANAILDADIIDEEAQNETKPEDMIF